MISYDRPLDYQRDILNPRHTHTFAINYKNFYIFLQLFYLEKLFNISVFEKETPKLPENFLFIYLKILQIIYLPIMKVNNKKIEYN